MDSKFRVLVEILSEVRSTNPNAKVLIFTFFRATARYLEKQLTKLGWNTLRIDGDVKSEPRRPERDDRGQRIDRFQNDPSVTVMVSTEVGSEGLDFQFCHHLVNYDLPWNPMVVEQRIGRIDRFGQEQDCVYIHNLVVTGTVEERILERLYSRIGIFERSIGNLEAILGETVRELQRDYVMATLKPDEAARRLQEAEDAVVRQGQHLESLESKAAELFGHEEFIRDEMTARQQIRQIHHCKRLCCSAGNILCVKPSCACGCMWMRTTSALCFGCRKIFVGTFLTRPGEPPSGSREHRMTDSASQPRAIQHFGTNSWNWSTQHTRWSKPL
ncbi:MAG UNVERIFIED_CONTAM: hypothetical protein LVR18_00710 [Planctomycetaceae bacterium]